MKSFLKKFDKEDVKYIKKYLPLREREKITDEIIVFEPLVKDLLDWQNGTLTEMDFLSRCINIDDLEVAMLPLSIYKKSIKKLFNFIVNEDEEKEEEAKDENEVKKN